VKYFLLISTTHITEAPESWCSLQQPLLLIQGSWTWGSAGVTGQNRSSVVGKGLYEVARETEIQHYCEPGGCRSVYILIRPVFLWWKGRAKKVNLWYSLQDLAITC